VRQGDDDLGRPVRTGDGPAEIGIKKESIRISGVACASPGKLPPSPSASLGHPSDPDAPPDLMLLQDLNLSSSAALRDAAGANWMVSSIDLHTPEPDDTPCGGTVSPSPRPHSAPPYRGTVKWIWMSPWRNRRSKRRPI
jgi:hypothetical protein